MFEGTSHLTALVVVHVVEGSVKQLCVARGLVAHVALVLVPVQLLQHANSPRDQAALVDDELLLLLELFELLLGTERGINGFCGDGALRDEVAIGSHKTDLRQVLASEVLTDQL